MRSSLPRIVPELGSELTSPLRLIGHRLDDISLFLVVLNIVHWKGSCWQFLPLILQLLAETFPEVTCSKKVSKIRWGKLKFFFC